MPKRVDTAQITDHRKLHFESIDALLSEIDRIAAADDAGRLRCAGNWTAGQAFGHLATWLNFGWDGYPFKVPWFLRFIVRRKIRGFLKNGMTPGVKIPNMPGGTLGIEPLSTGEGRARLHAALLRLKAGEPAKFESPAFGPMSEADRTTLTLRHAELHLGFLHPR